MLQIVKIDSKYKTELCQYGHNCERAIGRCCYAHQLSTFEAISKFKHAPSSAAVVSVPRAISRSNFGMVLAAELNKVNKLLEQCDSAIARHSSILRELDDVRDNLHTSIILRAFQDMRPRLFDARNKILRYLENKS